MRKQNGFSLIELLIVVAIILIIAAIAIPNLLRARIAANEASSVASLRTINTAEVTYLTAYPTSGYSITLAALGPAAAGACATPTSINACLLDFTLSQASTIAKAKSGYFFGIVNGTPATVPPTSYVAGAAPAAFNSTGVRGFCSVEDGVVRATPGAAAAIPAANTAACIAYTHSKHPAQRCSKPGSIGAIRCSSAICAYRFPSYVTIKPSRPVPIGRAAPVQPG